MIVLLVLIALSGAALWRLFGPTSGTTLRAVWWWATLSCAALLAVEIAIVNTGASPQAPWVQLARYAAAATTFCPMMALLGAKRPQDRAWQMIVLSLWVVLILPAIQWTLHPSNSTLEVWGAWRWFIGLLLLIGLTNHLPTRFWAATMAAGIGQAILLRNSLPFGKFEVPFESLDSWLISGSQVFAIGLFVAAAWLILFALARSNRLTTESTASTEGLNRVWFEFRDLYGVVWALRVSGFINSYAERYEWRVLLTWGGFMNTERSNSSESDASRQTAKVDSDEDNQVNGELEARVLSLSSETETALTNSFRTTLRRFVSPEWIDLRLNRECDVRGRGEA